MTGISAIFGRAYFLTDSKRKIASIGPVVFGDEEFLFNKWMKIREYKLKTKIINKISNLKSKIKYDKGHNTRMYSALEEYVPLALNNSESWLIDNHIPSRREDNAKNFYIRTETPNQYSGNIKDIELIGVDANITLKTDSLIEQSKPLGSFMMECAGNDRYAGYRLLSVANWDGVLFSELLKKDINGKSLLGLATIDSKATHILIEGFDDSTNTKWNRLFGVKSTKGASWIFSFDELIKQNAFFATKMNDSKLTTDHGYPVRLIVPGYYGCASIKWVNKMSFITQKDQTPTENQMREFSDRTGQVGVPKMLKNHKPPTTELSAVPVTIEKWKSKSGKVRYKFIGIIWGGIHEDNPEFNIILRNVNRKKEIVIQDKVTLGPKNRFSFQHWEYWADGDISGRFLIDIECTNKALPATRLKNHYYRRIVKI